MRTRRARTEFTLVLHDFFLAARHLFQTDANFCRLYEDVGLSLGEIFARMRYVCEHALLLLMYHLRAYRLIDLSHEIDPRSLLAQSLAPSPMQSSLASQPQYALAGKPQSQRQAAAAAVGAVSESRVGDGWLSDASVRRVRECRKDLRAFAQIKFQHVACAALLRLETLLAADLDALHLSQSAAAGASRK